MKKTLATILSIVMGVFILVGCDIKSKPISQTKTVSAEEIFTTLQEEGLTINDLEVYTADNDPNSLLGRPNQYVSKANFEFGSVETFKTEKDLKTRKEYIESVTQNMPALTEYMIVNGLYLLRLNKDLTPDQVSEFETAFMIIK